METEEQVPEVGLASEWLGGTGMPWTPVNKDEHRISPLHRRRNALLDQEDPPLQPAQSAYGLVEDVLGDAR